MAWFLHGLTLIFVAAKLFTDLTWSWWLVLAPSLLGIGFLLFLILTAIVTFIIAIFAAFSE